MVDYANAISATPQEVAKVPRSAVEETAGIDRQTFRDSLLSNESSAPEVKATAAQMAPAARPAGPLNAHTQSAPGTGGTGRADEVDGAGGTDGSEASSRVCALVELHALKLNITSAKSALLHAIPATKTKSKALNPSAEPLQKRDAGSEVRSGLLQPDRTEVPGSAIAAYIAAQPAGLPQSVRPQAINATPPAANKPDAATLRNAKPPTSLHTTVASAASPSASVALAPETAQHKPQLMSAPANVVHEHADASPGQTWQSGIAGAMSLISNTRSASSHGPHPPPDAPSPSPQPEQPGDARTLAATPNSLEVGVANGSHGWLRVRAELDASGLVRAAVVASSAGSAEALSRHLPEMSAYLTQESTRIGSLVVHASAQSGAASSQANGSEGFSGMGRFSGGQPGQSSAGGEAEYRVQARRRQDAAAASYESATGLRIAGGMGSNLAAFPAWQNGTTTHWVSVRV